MSNKKRFTFFAMILLIVIIFSSIFSKYNVAYAYKDVKKGDWMYEAVEKLRKDGKIKGYSDGTFRPGNKMTRLEFVRILDVNGPKRKKDFKDIPKSHPDYEVVMRSGAEGGGNNYFIPNEYISKEQAIVLMYKASKDKKIDESIDYSSKFKDFSDVSKWAIEPMKWAITQGIILGNGGKIKPADKITRAEGASVVLRYDNFKKDVEVKPKETPTPKPTISPTPTPSPSISPSPTPTDEIIPGGGTIPLPDNGGGGTSPPPSNGGGGSSPPPNNGGGGTSPTPDPGEDPNVALISLYTRNNLGAISEITTSNFFSNIENILPGWRDSDTLIVKNNKQQPLKYELRIEKAIIENPDYNKNFQIQIKDKDTSQIVLEKTFLKDLLNIPSSSMQLFLDNPIDFFKNLFNKEEVIEPVLYNVIIPPGASDEYEITLYLFDSDEEQNELKGKSIDFSFEVISEVV